MIIFNSKAKDFLCIVLHGLNSSSSEISYSFTSIAKKLEFVKFIFLDSDRKKVRIYGNEIVNAWYSLNSYSIFDRSDINGFQTSKNRILFEINSHNFHPSKVVLVGFSQGAAMASYVALNTDFVFKKVIMLSGYLPMKLEYSNTTKQNLMMIHGLFDGQIPYFIGIYSRFILRYFYKQKVEFVTFFGTHVIPKKIEKIFLEIFKLKE
ncbi:phospholipase/carboxylesterase [Hamiltosporidium magnivora]|uniref:Phospholipase/carboxylesterase n=1 Tax=Hamiltosporidium magnivora TaxID=148818 RepID=A0A4Q9LMW0_9MICR|nr:phospholipase/carboxylesterase [Hamiltosporidium magnivora]